MRRSEQIHRILRVQEQLREIAEAQLRAAEARRHKLETVRSYIFQSLASDDPQDRALSAMVGDRLRWVDRDISENEILRRDLFSDWQEIAQKQMAAQRVYARIDLEERNSLVEELLEDIIDNLPKAAASLR
jgi:hypothetical protein